MRTTIAGLAMGLLLLAGCSKPAPDGGAPDVAEEAKGPDVGATPAAGVAMTYSYVFRVPVARVAALQEVHAAQCEALGVARCRVAFMTYRVQPQRRIVASLEVMLAPDIARAFGKRGIDAVVAQGGMLTSADINSEDVGVAVASGDRTGVSVDQEQRDLTAQLQKPGLGSAERTQIQTRLAQLADGRRQAQTARDEAQRKLAGTPMRFAYESGEVDPGFSDGPILGALKDGWSNIVWGSAALLVIFITLLPWGLLLAAVIWISRRWITPLLDAKRPGDGG
ncbi:DUF4349 domain-containing protein [Sphingomonas naphthae]|uniref:DUF4349 domain-containing protein n=1 Tax=Sphingomonas naphthae TaxID=1813468 RepID=A0ABY7TKH4_9SPHN|nr:DUF4349 domain-containing protein [Sphingomonas naphthae]WCT73543.1 DUF4349 domain-containing protein [Sphingomonas naphthae]